jgi:hypothetical protein
LSLASKTMQKGKKVALSAWQAASYWKKQRSTSSTKSVSKSGGRWRLERSPLARQQPRSVWLTVIHSRHDRTFLLGPFARKVGVECTALLALSIIGMRNFSSAGGGAFGGDSHEVLVVVVAY